MQNPGSRPVLVLVDDFVSVMMVVGICVITWATRRPLTG